MKENERNTDGVAFVPLSLVAVFVLASFVLVYEYDQSKNGSPSNNRNATSRKSFNPLLGYQFLNGWLESALSFGPGARGKHERASQCLLPRDVKKFADLFWKHNHEDGLAISFLLTSAQIPATTRAVMSTVIVVDGVLVSQNASGEVHNYQSVSFEFSVSRCAAGFQIDSFKTQHFAESSIREFLKGGFSLEDSDFRGSHIDEIGALRDFCYAQNALLRGSFVESINTLNELVQRAPWFATAYARLGYVLSLIGDWKNANAQCDYAIALNPQAASAYFYRGLVRSSWNKASAIDDYTKAFLLSPTVASIGNRAAVRFALGDLSGAEADNRTAIGIDGSLPYLHSNLAAVLEKRGLLKEAIAEYDLTIAIEPNFECIMSRCELKRKTGDFRGGVIDATRAIRLKPGNSWAYFLRGDMREELDDDTGALADFSEALRLNPASFDALTSRGRLFARYGRNDEAMRDVNRAIELYPKCCGPRMTRCLVRLRLNDTRGATDDANINVELHPDDPAAYWVRGQFYLRTGEASRALCDFDRSLALSDSQNDFRTICYSDRAHANSVLGRVREAIQDLDSSISLGGRSIARFEHRARLKRLAGDLVGAGADQLTAWKLAATNKLKSLKIFSPNFM